MDFQNSFTVGNRTKFPTKSILTIPSICCRIILQNLEVKICGNLHKEKQSKNRVTFDKNWHVSCHMADYCQISCLKCCLTFAHTHAPTPLINCIVDDALVNALPHMLLQLINVVHKRSTDSLLDDAPCLIRLVGRVKVRTVLGRVKVRTVLWPQIWWNESRRARACSRSRTV